MYNTWEMNITTLAKQLKVTRRTIYNMIADGRVKARKDFNGNQYISKREAERLIKAQSDMEATK